MTTETITDYETVERTTTVTVCDLCGCDDNDTTEMVVVTSNFHICVECIVEYDDTVDEYDEIEVTESMSGINYIKPQTVHRPLFGSKQPTVPWWDEQQDAVDIAFYFVMMISSIMVGIVVYFALGVLL
jgi:hypothetical protein